MGKDRDVYIMLLPSLVPMVSLYHAVLTLEGNKLLSAHLVPTYLKQDLYPHSFVPLEPPRWLLSSLELTGERKEDSTLWEDAWGQLRPTLLENLQPEVLTLQLSASCV